MKIGRGKFLLTNMHACVHVSRTVFSRLCTFLVKVLFSLIKTPLPLGAVRVNLPNATGLNYNVLCQRTNKLHKAATHTDQLQFLSLENSCQTICSLRTSKTSRRSYSATRGEGQCRDGVLSLSRFRDRNLTGF